MESGGGAARIKFVVGEGAADNRSSDVLFVPVAEQLLVRRFKGGGRKKIRGVSSYSTYSLYLKTVHFLRYAASQPEPAIVLGDDDIFVQPHALLGYTWSLLEAAKGGAHGHQQHWYAGRFDWYSWRTETLMARVLAALRGALFGAQEPATAVPPAMAGYTRPTDAAR